MDAAEHIGRVQGLEERAQRLQGQHSRLQGVMDDMGFNKQVQTQTEVGT